MRNRATVFLLLASSFAGALVLSLSVGSLPITLGQVFRILSGGGADGGAGETAIRVVLTLRLPRALLGALVGGALSSSGVAYPTLEASKMLVINCTLFSRKFDTVYKSVCGIAGHTTG